MSDFYKAFEDRYRGSREMIAARLRVYLPFIAPLPALYQPARALDVGCGRGEWLELAAESGFAASGVDLDDAMLAACRARGLEVQTADALATLRAMDDASLALLSAFHVVEHMPFDDVRALLAEALRVLQPGGLLILETPNPENLVVGATSFYLDPSHLRPLPPLLLSFAAEHAGFGRVKVLRLQEDPALRDARFVGLQHVLDGVSPDYAVVAQKAAAPQVLEQFDAAFAPEHGLALGELAHRHDEQLAQAREDARASLEQLAQQAQRVERSTEHLGEQMRVHGEHLHAHGERIHAHGEHIHAHGEHLRTHDEHIRTHGEHIRTHGEDIRAHGEHIRTHDEDIRAHGEHIRTHDEDIR
ncbi:class I SAM-dependent methyltransferase, partial [Massilia horti]